jgi:DNA-binding MarR family transcriptional regulator
MIEGKKTYCKCLFYSVSAMARIMTRMAEEEFAPLGMAPSYAFVLMTVNSQPGIQPKFLSSHIQLTPSTVTRLVEKMEQKGFLQRKMVGRATEIYPTQKSLDLNDKIKASWKNLYLRYSGLIGEEESKDLTAKINEALTKITLPS